NSSHYTLDACETSQFENHLRAVAGLPLGSTQARPFFAMVNLLAPRGPDAKRMGELQPIPVPRARPGVSIHWYQKQRLTPGRKMGHLNGSASTQAEFEKLLGELKRVDAEWIDDIEKAVSK